MSSLHLRILTPTGPVVDCQVKEVNTSGLEGEFGVLPGHLPFITALKIGPTSFIETDEYEPRFFALGAGYSEIFEDQVTLFVESAEEAADIDVERAKLALNKTQQELSNLPELPVEHPDFVRVNQAHQRAQNRIHVASLN